MSTRFLIFLAVLISVLTVVAVRNWPYSLQAAGVRAPATVYRQSDDTVSQEKPCANEHPEWRPAQIIEGVEIAEQTACEPDNPYDVAASVKGVNNLSMGALMQTHLADDALIKSDDLDHDGDPDIVRIKLEVVELNGASPDGNFLINTYDIAPGIQPGLWVFAPKSRGMALKHFNSFAANPFLRAPSPTIRVEQGDRVFITLENTHYLPHTIHLHGVDHPWRTSTGEDNDGVEEHAVYPGQAHTYEIKPRHAGTMLYHCHVQTAHHLMMGLSGLFVVEENRPDNWEQTFNIGAGKVRHPSVAVRESYSQEYDLIYQSIDKRLAAVVQQANDPRLIAHRMSRGYNITESFENYYLFNGHSFPHTIRDAMIVVEENEHIKLRLVNMQRSPAAIHFHGHKVTAKAIDGVDREDKGGQDIRDVFAVAPAQRFDLDLHTVNNGLNSYGPGLWMFHDHTFPATTSDGIEPGGNMAILAYKPLLDERGMPTLHDEVLLKLFNKDYYGGRKAVFDQGDFAALLGEPGPLSLKTGTVIIFGLSAGGAIGLLLVIVRLSKRGSLR